MVVFSEHLSVHYTNYELAVYAEYQKCGRAVVFSIIPAQARSNTNYRTQPYEWIRNSLPIVIDIAGDVVMTPCFLFSLLMP